MHQGQSVSTIAGEGPPIKAPQFGAVIAALVSGVEFSSADCLIDMLVERDGAAREEFFFTFNADTQATFEPSFARETIGVKEIERRFLSAEWVKANPHHPIAYMRAFFDERNKRVAEIKNRPRFEVVEERNTSGGTSRCFIPENATPEERAAILEDFRQSL